MEKPDAFPSAAVSGVRPFHRTELHRLRAGAMYMASNILLFIHFVALVVGAATNVAMPLVMRQMAKAAPEAKAGYGAIGRQLGINSRIALGVLVLSGVALLWLRYGGTVGMNDWFWIKMALVGLIVAQTIVMAVVGPGRINPRLIGTAARLILLGIVLSAVLAFN
jgi:hypothetical protein